MAIFGQYHWLTPWQKCQFFDFLNFLFLQRREKKVGKWPFWDRNYGLTTLEKCQFSDFLNFLFLQRSRALFRSKISQKTFSWLILDKKKVGKMAIFGPKPWLKPFEKNENFSTVELVVFIAQKSLFSFQNIVKDISLAYIA